MAKERRFVDLHTHSTASDGAMEPAELIRLADSIGLYAVALTDHDTTQGLAAAAEAAKAYPQLHFVPGLEVSATFPGGTLHILGLGIDASCPALQSLLEQLRAARNERNPRMVQKLRDLGMEISMQDVLEMAAVEPTARAGTAGVSVVGRMHVALAMQKKGFVHNAQEAFNRYLGDGKVAYIDKERILPRDAIAAIRAAGGIAVLAHPPQLKYQNNLQFERILRDMMDHGLEGIEVYHSDNNIQQTRFYLDLARRLNLAISGGSDFHGRGKPDVLLGHPRVPLAAFDAKWAKRLFG